MCRKFSKIMPKNQEKNCENVNESVGRFDLI